MSPLHLSLVTVKPHFMGTFLSHWGCRFWGAWHSLQAPQRCRGAATGERAGSGGTHSRLVTPPVPHASSSVQATGHRLVMAVAMGRRQVGFGVLVSPFKANISLQGLCKPIARTGCIPALVMCKESCKWRCHSGGAGGTVTSARLQDSLRFALGVCFVVCFWMETEMYGALAKNRIS